MISYLRHELLAYHCSTDQAVNSMHEGRILQPGRLSDIPTTSVG